jgi:uncharacterized protein GlcG (DUF336 family)
MPHKIESLTLRDARRQTPDRLIAAGERKAEELKIPYNIAVVDAGGSLISHVRMDGAWRGSIDISINKAFTARAFDMTTDDLSKAAQSGESLFGIHTTNDARIVILGGGVPVKVDGTVIGAIGASGGSVENDVTSLAGTASFRTSILRPALGFRYKWGFRCRCVLPSCE